MRFSNSIGVLTMSLAMMGIGCGADTVHADEESAQTAVGTMLDMEQMAWNRGDSVAYANVYTDDADFINVRGQVFTGKPAVQQQHEKIFGGPFKGSVIAITVRKFKMLAKGMALVDTDQTVTNFRGLPPGVVATSTGSLVTHFKYLVLQQSDGSWKVASGQNTAALPN